jgi:clan AA aspartic protease (TIGR02281 family)
VMRRVPSLLAKLSGPRCHAHPASLACTVCRSCAREICEICVALDAGAVPRCVACWKRRALRVRVAAAVLALFAVGASGMAWRSMRQLPTAAQVDTTDLLHDSPEATAVARLRAQVQREPCDRRRIVELAERTLRAGDGRDTLNQAETFFRKCGEHPRLREISYQAHKQLSQWSGAAADAGKLIELDPQDANYRGWRGLVYEESGDLLRAAEDYEQALLLKPHLADLPMNLAAAYEKLGKPCSAILPLAQVVTYYPEARNVDSIQARIARLASMGECAWSAGEGQALIRSRPGAHVMTARVRINERDCGTFIVDTGATLVVLSRRAAVLLGLNLTGAPRLYTQTANGVGSGSAVVLDLVEVQGVRAARVSAAVVDELVGVDGLLGMSFLSRFDLHRSNGVLEIKARKRPARASPEALRGSPAP